MAQQQHVLTFVSIDRVPPRVPLCDPDRSDVVVRRIIRRRARDASRVQGGEQWLATLDRVLLHSPPLAAGWSDFFGAIRDEMTVTARLREIAILRVANLNGDTHNRWHHEEIARQSGFTEAEILALRNRALPTEFSDLERAVLAYADALTVDVKVDEAVFAAVRDLVTTREMVEITGIIASYNCVSRFLVGMGIDREIE
jgi:alkylhydroperoxidase family enzyme